MNNHLYNSEAESAEELKTQIEETKNEIGSKANHMGDQLKQYGARLLRRQVDTLADRLFDAKYSASDKATELRENGSPVTATPFDLVSDGVGKIREFFENRTAENVAEDCKQFARTHPFVTVGSAFLFGIVAARAFKASANSH